MKALASATLLFALVSLPIVAAQSALAFGLELGAGMLAAWAPYYAALAWCHEALDPLEASRFRDAVGMETVIGLAGPPLAGGVAVACVGSLFGVTDQLGCLAAILGASFAEGLAFRVLELNSLEWMEVFAVPAITALGATLAFNRAAARTWP